ncbi:nuclear transport factor 2 family protein [Spirosoma sp.]|uniref:nuclear transport factor 2 family protein n=1 Tax=Spirosoma sp. TaxID=1899569 RepID=UPI0026247671|nr:nuclear transport factor 2 family protein [Spirosoma sp.]MCX6216668.1 nuclear transport factor 2 family protein [Spirosoma sp.]
MTFFVRILLASLLLMPYSVIAQRKVRTSTLESAEVTVIRALRQQSNLAIEKRDLSGFGETMLPEIDVTRGSGSHVSGRDSVLASVAVQFKDPAFLGYVRMPDSIQVSTSNPLAAEHGHWTGRFQRADGVQTITGSYLSMWRKTGQGWKIRSELFVSLSCTGSVACGK